MAFDYKEKFSVAGKKVHRYRCSTGTFRGMAEGLLEIEVVCLQKSCRQLQMNTARWVKQAGQVTYPKAEIDRFQRR